jgi:acetyl-CoA C-acetyltransferase
VSAEPVVIVAARRTPIGAFQGSLAPVTTPLLGATAIRACLEDSGLRDTELHQALMGCVLQAGVGQAPARQAVLAAGLTSRLPTMTINKVCGSGLATVILGHDMIRTGSAGVVLAGGMESMSNTPYLLPRARAGYRMGHQQVLDHMFTDGLQNPYDGNMMGPLRGTDRAQVRLHARRAGCVRNRVRAPRAGRLQRRAVQGRDHPGDGKGPRG